MLNVQFLKLPLVAPEKKPDPSWTRLKLGSSSGFCASRDRSLTSCCWKDSAQGKFVVDARKRQICKHRHFSEFDVQLVVQQNYWTRLHQAGMKCMFFGVVGYSTL